MANILALTTDSLLAAASGKPNLDLDFTLVIQTILFFILWIGLTKLVFKPYLKAREERDQLTEGLVEKAQTLNTEATTLLSDYESKIKAHRDEASAIRGEVLNKTTTEAAALRAKAQGSAKTHLDAEREKIAAQVKDAQSAVRPRAEELSELIVQKILAV